MLWLLKRARYAKCKRLILFVVSENGRSGMKHSARFLLLGLAALAPRSVVADVSQTAANAASEPDRAPDAAAVTKGESEAREERVSLVSAGLRVGLFPPILTAVEISFRPVNHLAMSAYGMYLGGDGARLLAAASVTAELAASGQSGWYLSTGFLHYNQATNSKGFYETSVIVPVTAGYVFRSRWLELQLGAGAQVVALDDTSPCTGFWCFKFNQPPVLPAVDLGVRYRF